jgi:enolase-phosphatase E1
VPSGHSNEVRVLLLDIEGTTTPIDFVYKTLFPYAVRHVERFLRAHFSDPEINALVQDLKEQHERDNAGGRQATAWLSGSDEDQLSSCAAYARWLIANDSKCIPLKALQGKIWQQGFANGELHGEVYPDVPPAFERWRKQERQICIYSSGSVLAQQQLFQTLVSGDLTPYIAAYFDTHTGIKTVAASYTKITTSLGRSPREFLFVSDATKEVEAAHSAEMHAVLCDRGAPASPQPNPAGTIHTFDEIFPS